MAAENEAPARAYLEYYCDDKMVKTGCCCLREYDSHSNSGDEMVIAVYLSVDIGYETAAAAAAAAVIRNCC